VIWIQPPAPLGQQAPLVPGQIETIPDDGLREAHRHIERPRDNAVARRERVIRCSVQSAFERILRRAGASLADRKRPSYSS
jgi:hypothetical protein